MNQIIKTMKKLIIYLFVTIFFVPITYSQIIIDDNDMPNVDDTIRTSTALFTTGDYTSTGANFTWDFSDLYSLNQTVDTFVSIYSTPLVYNLVFLYPFVATIATEQPDFDLIPTMNLTNVYNFYKETSSEYAMVGYGAYISGVPVPVKYDNPDVLYNFPVTYGAVDSSTSFFSQALPTLGFFSELKKRTNTVDGWGTLTTPYGTFQTVRIKSEITLVDSIYIDAIGFGFNIPSTSTEYKWLGDGFGLPLLQIDVSGFTTNITYIDSARSMFNPGFQDNEPKRELFTVFPNPASDLITVNFRLAEMSDVEIGLYSINGEKIDEYKSEKMNEGNHNIDINLSKNNVKSGVYIVNFTVNGLNYTKRLIVY